MRRVLCGAAVCGLVLALPASARGDGLPVPGAVDAGASGVASPSSRYVTLPAGHDTVVARVRLNGGQVLLSRVLRGTFTIPAVALDGSASGLSGDGRTLVLIRPRASFPQRRTRLAVLDARRLALRDVVTLRGDFSYDALSPDGRTMYLIEYQSRRDPSRYAVRAYDVDSSKLLRAPIVDPREPDERMRGLPITRLASPDGRWAYTLYDGAGSNPFVHALDTARGEAACIDLDALAGFERLYDLRLGLSGRDLSVLDGKTPLALVDRTTHQVREPAAAEPPARPPARPPSDDGGIPPWALAAAAAALLLGLSVTIGRWRHARTSTRLSSSTSPTT